MGQVAGPAALQEQTFCNLAPKKTPWQLVRKRTIPTEGPPLVEVSANYIYREGTRGIVVVKAQFYKSEGSGFETRTH
jgi:hypothetical protein